MPCGSNSIAASRTSDPAKALRKVRLTKGARQKAPRARALPFQSPPRPAPSVAPRPYKAARASRPRQSAAAQTRQPVCGRSMCRTHHRSPTPDAHPAALPCAASPPALARQTARQAGRDPASSSSIARLKRAQAAAALHPPPPAAPNPAASVRAAPEASEASSPDPAPPAPPPASSSSRYQPRAASHAIQLLLRRGHARAASVWSDPSR